MTLAPLTVAWPAFCVDAPPPELLPPHADTPSARVRAAPIGSRSACRTSPPLFGLPDFRTEAYQLESASMTAEPEWLPTNAALELHWHESPHGTQLVLGSNGV